MQPFQTSISGTDSKHEYVRLCEHWSQGFMETASLTKYKHHIRCFNFFRSLWSGVLVMLFCKCYSIASICNLYKRITACLQLRFSLKLSYGERRVWFPLPASLKTKARSTAEHTKELLCARNSQMCILIVLFAQRTSSKLGTSLSVVLNYLQSQINRATIWNLQSIFFGAINHITHRKTSSSENHDMTFWDQSQAGSLIVSCSLGHKQK